VKEVANVLLANGLKVIRAGRRREWLRVALFPLAIPSHIKTLLSSGRLTGVGLWDLCGLADFVYAEKPSSGNVSIHQVQVAFIGSDAVGGGTSYYGGRRYLFKLRGLGFGVSTLDATGSVYNLRRLQDFEGRLWSGSHRMGNRQPRQGGDVAAKLQRRTLVSQSKASRFIPDPGSRRHARPSGRVALPTAPAIRFTSGFAATP
jgi:hypothetical protein